MREGGGGGGDAIIHLERREDGGGTLKGILMEYNLIPVVVVDRGEGGFVLAAQSTVVRPWSIMTATDG